MKLRVIAVLVLSIALMFGLSCFADEDVKYLGDLEVTDDAEYYFGADETMNGTTIKVGGIEYEHGISTHPNSSGSITAIYNIEGLGYKKFFAIAGKDATAGAAVGGDPGINGTHVQFLVYVDGELKSDSGMLAYPDVYVFDVDITGAKELKIVVSDGGDTIYCDASSLANAQLIKNESDIPVIPTASPSPMPTAVPTQDPGMKDKDKVYISDMPLLNLKAYMDLVSCDGNIKNEYLYLDGVYFEKGICMHALPGGAESMVEVDISGCGFKRFVSYIGIAESTTDDLTMGSVVFRVYCDGELKYESNTKTPMLDETEEPDTELVNIDITDVKILRLAVTNAGDSHSGDWACWGGAAVSKKENVSDILATPVPTPSPVPTPVKTASLAPAKTSAPTSALKTADAENEKSGSDNTALYIGLAIVAVVVIAVVVILIRKKKR